VTLVHVPHLQLGSDTTVRSYFAFPARHEATLPVLRIHRALGPAQMLNFVQQDAPVLPRLRHHPPAFHDLADAVSGGFHLQLGSDEYVMQIVMYATRLRTS
jgi:hypothetical protein